MFIFYPFISLFLHIHDYFYIGALAKILTSQHCSFLFYDTSVDIAVIVGMKKREINSFILFSSLLFSINLCQFPENFSKIPFWCTLCCEYHCRLNNTWWTNRQEFECRHVYSAYYLNWLNVVIMQIDVLKMKKQYFRNLLENSRMFVKIYKGRRITNAQLTYFPLLNM